jgi:hypothetical protein
MTGWACGERKNVARKNRKRSAKLWGTEKKKGENAHPEDIWRNAEDGAK